MKFLHFVSNKHLARVAEGGIISWLKFLAFEDHTFIFTDTHIFFGYSANDQTALHYAVLSGKLEAVEYLLKKEKFLEMIDFTDEINITAAGYATQAGYSEILRCLLENNAQMKSDKKTARRNILDSAYGFFKTGEDSLKEIVEFCSKDSKTGMLQQVTKEQGIRF